MEEKLLVTVELGLTLPVGDFGNVKPRVVLANIDPHGDVKAQVEVGLNAASTAFTEIDGHMDQVLSEILAPETGNPGFKSRLEVAEKQLEVARENIKRIAKKLKEVDQAFKDRVEEVVNGEET